MILGNYMVTSGGKILKTHRRYPKIPFAWHVVTNADFENDYSNSTRLGGLTSTETAIKIPSHPKTGTLVNQIWNGANSYTKHITFTDEDDFALNSFDTSNNNTVVRESLLSITNIPSSIKTLRVNASNINTISSVSDVTSFSLKYNTSMKTLDGVIGLSDSDNLSELYLKENTGLIDVSSFVIPKNVTTFNALFQGCSNLKKVRIDYNYTDSTWASSNLMFQRTSLKRLDIYASNVLSRNMFSGFSFSSGSVEIRSVPGTNTWEYWKTYMEANDTPFRSSYAGALRFCLHSFSSQPKSIAIWGDSLTKGGDGTTYSDLCVKLSDMLVGDAVVQNLGAGGTSAAGQAQYFLQYDVGWDDVTILFYGHNTPETTIQAYNESYIPHLPKYIVLGLVTKNYSTSMNNQMAEEYGEHFVDTHAYMIANGFAITGLTPTAQDEDDLANGRVPHSFLASDYIHMNEYGGLIVATAIKEKLLSLGYINNTWLATT